MRQRLRSPAAGVPIGVLAGMIAAPVLWQTALDASGRTTASALLIAGGVGVALAATVATLWYGLASSRRDR